MSNAMHIFLSIDLMPLLAVTLALLACGLIGNFLVLRRQSMLGDAISHAVLPGLVIAFILSGTRAPLPMFIGAAIAGGVVAVLAELVRRLGRVEAGASLGTMFTIAFALGVLLLERATSGGGAARQVDLDADCVLHGLPETLTWDAPNTWGNVFTIASLETAPPQIAVLLGVFIVVAACIAIFFKELRIICFDPALATALGFKAGPAQLVIVALVATCTVASFEAVGSILVIAALICPAATARMLTDRLTTQIWLSAIIAINSAVLGYAAAGFLPGLLWDGYAVSAAGAITVVLGIVFTLSALFSPSQGIVARAIARQRLTSLIAVEDLLALLYRSEERGHLPISLSSAHQTLGGHRGTKAINRARRASQIDTTADRIALTASGQRDAAAIIRRHRLWESYLVDEAGIAADHTHDVAEVLEHTRDDAERPIAPVAGPGIDPHGKVIPKK